MPAPVPPPSECESWKPWRQSQDSASLRTTSSTESISSAPLGVVALGPVVASAGLAENEVVRAEDLAIGTSADGVHGTGLKIHQDGAGDVATAGGLVVVDVDALELQIGVALVGTGGVNTMFIRNDLPKLGTDLVTALTTLDGDDLTHVVKVSKTFFFVDGAKARQN